MFGLRFYLIIGAEEVPGRKDFRYLAGVGFFLHSIVVNHYRCVGQEGDYNAKDHRQIRVCLGGV